MGHVGEGDALALVQLGDGGELTNSSIRFQRKGRASAPAGALSVRREPGARFGSCIFFPPQRQAASRR